ncbi:hypothetical protein BDR06DRAFT_994174 [Suillus hirtellus]|nr:hypothetical protein BDR06DRAFT_994174 [Suillus hirtellus]
MTCSFDGSLRLWDLESGTQIGGDWRDGEDEEAGMYSMALSPNVCWSGDGKRVLGESWDGTARVWDVKTGKIILIIETGHESPFWRSQTGSTHHLVSERPPPSECIIGQHIGPPLQHEDEIIRAALSADGKLLVTSCTDGNVPIRKSLKDACRIPPGFIDGTSPLHHVVHILSLLRPVLSVLAHLYFPFHVPFSNDFRRSSTTLTAMLMDKPNSGNAQGAPSSPAVLVLSKLLQYGTETYFFLVHFLLPSGWFNNFCPHFQQRQLHAQGSSSQSQPTTTTPAQGTSTAAPGAATVQSQLTPLWALFVLFLCCASTPRANGH